MLKTQLISIIESMKVDIQRRPTAYHQLRPEFASRQTCSANRRFWGLQNIGFSLFFSNSGGPDARAYNFHLKYVLRQVSCAIFKDFHKKTKM